MSTMFIHLMTTKLLKTYSSYILTYKKIYIVITSHLLATKITSQKIVFVSWCGEAFYHINAKVYETKEN